MTSYFLSGGQDCLGPFDLKTLAAMGVRADTLVRTGPGGPWTVCGALDEIADAIQRRQDATGGGALQWGRVAEQISQDDETGVRRFSAPLMGASVDADKDADRAAELPNTVRGHYFARPDACHQTETGVVGQWALPDPVPGALTKCNAVVVYCKDAQIGFGQVGWGIRLEDARWCFGATENPGMPVIAGFANGAFLETGDWSDMVSAFSDGGGRGRPGWCYKMFKPLEVHSPDHERGLAAAQATALAGHRIHDNNCMDHAVSVLHAFAGVAVVPAPDPRARKLWTPHHWFRQVPGEGRALSTAL